jgi:hypothetical protein
MAEGRPDRRERSSHVEVRIGIARSAGEVVVSSAQTPDEVQELVAASFASEDGLLTLVDDQGRWYVVPAVHVAYVEVAAADEAHGSAPG